jgi:hypothetical protein
MFQHQDKKALIKKRYRHNFLLEAKTYIHPSLTCAAVKAISLWIKDAPQPPQLTIVVHKRDENEFPLLESTSNHSRL